MTIDELLKLHEHTCKQARDIMRAKNHDYTDGSEDPFANFRASEAIGVDPAIGILVRTLDKIKRLQTFANRGQLSVDGEGYVDAIRDTINYMVLLRGLFEERSLASNPADK